MPRIKTVNIWILCLPLMLITMLVYAAVPPNSSELPEDKTDLVVPFVLMVSPIEGEIFPSGAIISFNGSATDRDLMDITHTLVWGSSIDG